MKMRGLTIAQVAVAVGVAALAAPQAASAWCYVDLDKCIQVDDEGNGFDDDACVDDVAGVPEGVMVRWGYQVTNTSDYYWDLHNCEITDDDAGFQAALQDVLTTPLVDGNSSATVYSEAAECIDIVNTASVTCGCVASDQWPGGYTGGPGWDVTDRDTASLACEPPPPDISWTLTKVCEGQTSSQDVDVPYNPFTVQINNTGETDLTCRIVGDAVNDVAIPACGESSGTPCYACETYESPVGAGGVVGIACRLYGLPESAVDTVGVECTDGADYTSAKRASDTCEVPIPGRPDFEIQKRCGAQVDTDRPYNPFAVRIANTGDFPLACEIIGDAVDGEPISRCGEDGRPCYECEGYAGSLDPGEDAVVDCRLYGLRETAVDTVGVSCSYEDWTMAKRASAECFVDEPVPDFEVEKVCYPPVVPEVLASVEEPNGFLYRNPFLVNVRNTGEVGLWCEIIGDAVDGEPIPRCDANGPTAVPEGPCYYCPEDEAGLRPGEGTTFECLLVGLHEGATDTVGVSCETRDESWEMAKRASDYCPIPRLTVDKDCYPYEDDHNGDFVNGNGYPTHLVDIVVTNESPMALTDCRVRDRLDVECERGVNGECPHVECDVPESFELDGGESARFECAVFGLEYEEAMNYVEATCRAGEIRLTARDKDLCEVEYEPRACTLRSPGYWKRHLETAAWLAWVTGPVESCGEALYWEANSPIHLVDNLMYRLCEQGNSRYRKCAAATLNARANYLYETECARDLGGLVEACCSSCGEPDGIANGLDCDELLDEVIVEYNEMEEFCTDPRSDTDFVEVYWDGEAPGNCSGDPACENENGPPVAPASQRFVSPLDANQRFQMTPNGWWQYLFQPAPTGTGQLFLQPGAARLPDRDE